MIQLKTRAEIDVIARGGAIISDLFQEVRGLVRPGISTGELDRLCDALLVIREEIRAIERGDADRADNPLKHAPHTAAAVTADDWPHAYSRQQAAYPAAWVRAHKYWPPVARIDNAYGDRNLVCTCPPLEELAD